MALIRQFVRIENERLKRHTTEVVCGWAIVFDGGNELLHLRSGGSESRQNTDSTSQTFQLDKAQARELLKILADFI